MKEFFSKYLHQIQVLTLANRCKFYFGSLSRLLITTILFFCMSGYAAAKPLADYVFLNGRIYTVDPAQPWAEAIAVTGEKLVYVGNNTDVKQYISKSTQVVDLQNRMMLPGLHDIHMHTLTGGYFRVGALFSLYGPQNKAGKLKILEDHAQQLPPKQWVLAAGVNESESINHKELESVTGGRPAIVFGEKFHAAWLNTSALTHFGLLNKEMSDAENGAFERDDKGVLTGKIMGGGVIEYGVSRLGKIISPEKNLQAALFSISQFNQWGITSLLDAATVEGGETIFRTLLKQNKLNARMSLAFLYSPLKSEEDNLQLIKKLAFESEPYLRAKTVKLIADGAEQADMLEPYVDGSLGEVVYSQVRLNRMVSKINDAGLQLHIHAVGDGASKKVISAFKQANESGHYTSELRHTLSHLIHIYPGQAADMARMGLYGQMALGWAPPFPLTAYFEKMVGPERAKHMNDFESLIDSGVVLAQGSDWPAFGMINPFVHMEGGVTRHLPGDVNGKVSPGGKLDVATVIKMSTINGAKMMHQEQYTGSLEVNKRADLAILDQNLFEVPPSSISKTKVLLTMFDGRVVYSSGDLFEAIPKQ